jgi:hypothetical protein
VSYIDIDEFGIAEIRCMKCNIPVAIRSYKEMPDKKDKTKKVLVMVLKRLPIWRQRRRSITMLGNEAVIDAIYCADCSVSPSINQKEIKKKVILGWQEELKYQQKEDKEILVFEKKFKTDMKEVGIKAQLYTDAKEEKDNKGK